MSDRPSAFVADWVSGMVKHWVRGPYYILSRDPAGRERMLGIGVSRAVVDRFMDRGRRPDRTYEVGVLQ